MAENGNLINTNNNNNNNNQKKHSSSKTSNDEIIRRRHLSITSASLTEPTIIITTTSPTIRTTTLSVERGGYTEGDATHFRLRDIQPSTEYLKCLSCNEIIKSTSLLDIYDHFIENYHNAYYGNCLYCGGKVHRYYISSTQEFDYYHNCLRWKRGEDH